METIEILQKQLEKNKIKFDLVTSSAHLGFYETDLQTKLCEADDNFVKIFGLESNTFPIDIFQNLVHKEDFDRVMLEFGKCLQNKENFSAEYRCVKPNGEIIMVKSHSVFEYDLNNNPIRIFGFKQDMSFYKKDLEKLIQENIELKKLNAALLKEKNNDE